MSSALVRWQLRGVSRRLRARREELEVIGEQLLALPEGEDEEAMQRHRLYVVAEIRQLEQRQDELLDRM